MSVDESWPRSRVSGAGWSRSPAASRCCSRASIALMRAARRRGLRGAARNRRPHADRRRAGRGRDDPGREMPGQRRSRPRCTGRTSTQLSARDEVKFVIQDRADFDYAREVVDALRSGRRAAAVLLLARARRARAGRAGALDAREPRAGAAAAPGAQVHLDAGDAGRLMARRAVVLLSGGLDSATAAALARREGWTLYALTVRYGQMHAREIEAARRVAARARRRQARRDRRRSAALRRIGARRRRRDSRRTGRLDATRHSVHLRSGAQHRVPRRSRSPGPRSLDAERIVIGVNALDYSGYPDCRPEFIAAFEYLATLGHQGRRRGPAAANLGAAPAPDQGRRSSASGMELGVDYGLTHSCYDPHGEAGRAASCDSCRLRAKGFAEAESRILAYAQFTWN